MAITADQVKQLRERTGAGMLDCKRALEECGGSFDDAVAALRKKGISVASRREQKAATEGVVHAYIHANNKIGVLVEVNCETDFVARTDDFARFAKEISMQVAAGQPRWIAREDVPEAEIERERQILTDQAAAEGKPAHIVERMVEGRLSKFYAENCLLEQAYIRDDSVTIRDLLNDLLAKTGERLVIRRFVRFQVGEQS